MTRAHVVALLLFEGCDVMDVTGPYEVLLAANRLSERAGEPAPFDVRTVSVDGGPVTAYGGLGLVPSHGALADVDRIDLLVVPGLIDIDAGTGDETLVDAVATAAGRAGTTASVCTGAFLLEAAGVLGDRDATTHWEDVPALRARRAGSGAVRDDVRWVDTGDVVTAGALLDGVDAACHLVARVAGPALARAVARQLDARYVRHRTP